MDGEIRFSFLPKLHMLHAFLRMGEGGLFGYGVGREKQYNPFSNVIGSSTNSTQSLGETHATKYLQVRVLFGWAPLETFWPSSTFCFDDDSNGPILASIHWSRFTYDRIHILFFLCQLLKVPVKLKCSCYFAV
jgi:hypothetical protein